MDMAVTDPTLARVRRDRQTNRVEAWVHLDVRYHPRVAPRRVTLLASVPAQGGALRSRLIREANRIAYSLYKPARLV